MRRASDIFLPFWGVTGVGLGGVDGGGGGAVALEEGCLLVGKGCSASSWEMVGVFLIGLGISGRGVGCVEVWFILALGIEYETLNIAHAF